MRRFILVAFATASGAVLLGSCADDAAGPRQPLAGRFSVVPSFGALQGGIIEVARGRFMVTRIPSGAVAADTIVDIPPNADSVDLAIQVPVFEPGETFNLTIRLIDGNGDTVFAGGPIEVSPTTSGTPVPVEVPFTYVGTGADAAGIQITTPDTATFTGESLLLSAVALDSAEQPIPGTPIGWESLDTAVVRITGRDDQFRGTAVGGTQRGVARIVATLVTGQTDTVLISNQPLPTTLVTESGSGQSGPADSALPQPLVARVTAGDGQGVAGLWVRFTVTSGGGQVSADSALTDATGRASVTWTLARSFQPQTVAATTPRLATASAVFNATLVFAPPTTLEIVAGDGQTAVAGAPVATAPRVRVLDGQGLPVPGITVTFAVTGGGGIVTGGTPVTDTLGLATVTSWMLGTTAGPNALTATVNALTATFTATGIAGAASQLTLVSGNAQTGPVGQALPLPLVVRAADANGNAVAGATIDWSAGAGAVSTPSTATDAAGLAQVTWTLGATPGAQAAIASLNGTPATVGFTATAAAGAAARLAFTVEPSDAREDSVIAPAVVVTAYDALGNVATGFAGAVQLSLLTNPGGATLSGTTSRAAVAGVATFADLSLNAFGTGYALFASATGLVPDTSTTFDVRTVGQAFWVNGAGGDWSVGANWSSGAAPAATDTAFITLDGTYTVTVDQNVTVAALGVGGGTGVQTLAQAANVVTVGGDATFGATAVYALSGGSIGGGAFTVAGTMTWSGGTLAGTTSLTNAGSLTLAGAAAKTVGSTATFTNAGTIAHTGSGSLVLSVGSVVTNGNAALYDFQTDAAIDWVSGTTPEPFVNNSGTIRKSGGTGRSFIDQLQNLGGTIEVQTGELELRSYDGTTNTSTGGTFIVAAGAVLDLTSEQGAQYLTGTYQGAYTGSGSGTVLLDNGVLQAGTGATFTFPGSMLQWTGGTITGGVFTNAGTLTAAGAATKTLAAGATLSNTGTLAVEAGTLAVAGTFSHAAGAVLQGGGTLDLSGAAVPTFDGEVRPGTSPGLLTIAAPAGLALGATARVTAELGGAATAGTDYDQLRVTGQPLALGGTLNVTLIGPFVPDGTETWPLLTGVTGAFAAVNLPPLDLPWTIYLQNDTLFLGPPPVAGPGVNAWLAPANGLWSDGAGWSLGRAPIAGDTVHILAAGTYTVTLDVDASVDSLAIGGASGTQTLDPSGIRGLVLTGDGSVNANGRITVASGDLTVYGGSNLTIDGGTLHVEATRTFQLSDGADFSELTYLGGTIGGPGRMNVLPDAQFNVFAPLTVDALTIRVDDGAINGGVGEHLTIAAGATLELESSVGVNINIPVDNLGTMIVHGDQNYQNDTLTIASGGFLLIEDAGGEASSQLTVSGLLTNDGTIALDGSASYTSTLEVLGAGSRLENGPTGTILASGTGGGLPRTIHARVVNEGAITVNHPLEMESADTHLNTGTVNIVSGDLTVTHTGAAAAAFLNEGTFIIGDGRTATITGANFGNYYGEGALGVISGGGTLTVSGGTFVDSGHIRPGTSPGVLTINGNWEHSPPGVWFLELGTPSPEPQTGYDRIVVTGTAQDGQIDATTILAGYSPQDGDTLLVAVAGAWTGAPSVQLPTVPGFIVSSVFVDGAGQDSVRIVFTALPQPGVTWTGAAGNGLWGSAGNWDKNRVPGATDTAYIALAGAAVTLNVNATVRALEVTGTGASFTHNANTLQIDSSATFGPGTAYTLGGGTLTGAGAISLQGVLTWSAGTMSGAGSTTLTTGATGTWSTTSSKILDARTLVLDGPVTWPGGGTLQLQNVATLVNNSTLSFTSAAAGALGSAGTGPNTVTNAGSVVKSGTGTLTVIPEFNNTGTVDHQAGLLTLNGGGTHTGPFTVATGAALDFPSGTHTLGGDVTGAGAVTISGATVTLGAAATWAMPAVIVTVGAGTFNGTLGPLDSIRVTGGTLTLQSPAATVPVPRLSLLGGTLQGTDSVLVSGTWDWSAGTLGAGLGLQATAAGSWTTTGSKLLNAHTLVLDGPVTWPGGGTLQLQNGATLVNNNTLAFTSAAAGAFGSAGTGPNVVTNAGSFVKSGAGTLSIVTPFTNTGVLDVQTGTVGVSGAFTHADGALLRGSGTLNLTGAAVSTFSGDVSPGTSPGILTVTTPAGGLTQGPLSTLTIELDGPNAGTGYDRLSFSGDVTLNGSLVVTRSFTPNLGDRFAILTFANRTGQFSSVSLPLVDGLVLDTLWAIDADAIDTLYLVANAAAPPGPPGTETAWLGTASADWADPQNWFGGHVPDDTTSTFVQAGTPFSPQVAVGQTGQADTLVLQTGASLTVDGSLSVFGDLDAGFESIGGSGTVTLAGITGVVSGSLPRTVVAGDYTLAGPLLVNGELRLEGPDSTAPDVPGTNLRLNGNKAVVTGDFTTALFGHLYMQDPADTLDVQGSATFNGDETVSSLTNGVLLVAGDFTQLGSIRSASFHPTGSQKTVLNGGATQTVSFQNTASRLSTFANLEITNPVGVTFATEIVALGAMTVAQPIAIAAPTRLIVDGPLAFNPAAALTTPYLQFGGTVGVTAANFVVDTAAVAGTALPDSLPYATVLVAGVATLVGPTAVGGNLLVRSVLDVSGQTLVVNGDLVVADGPSARLQMLAAADSVVVNGNAVFNGAPSPGFGLDAGVLDLKGNFTQTGTPDGGNNFVAAGTHLTVFSGDVNQTISFTHPDSSWFHHVIVANTEVPVGLATDAAATGDLTLPVGVQGLTGPEAGITVLGAIDVRSPLSVNGLGVFGTLNADPAAYNVSATIFGGAPGQTIPDSVPYQNVSVLTDASLAGTTTVTGILTVTGDPGAGTVALSVGPYALSADQLVVSGSGILRMTDAAGTVNVAGSAIFDGFPSAGELTAGVLRLGGDFTQLATNDPASFAASPGHTVEFTGGPGAQAVTFATPGPSASHFGDVLYSTNSAVLTLVSPAAVAGTFTTAPALGFFRQVSGSASTPLTTANLDADSLEFAGVPVTITDAAANLTDVHFTSQDPTVTQLEVRGTTGGLTFTGTRFFTQPDGGRYLYVADNTGPGDGAFTLTMDQTIPTSHDGLAQTDGVAQLLGWPGSAPVLFASSAGDPVGLFSVNGDGSGLNSFAASEGTEGLVHPRWAPDRSRVAYSFGPIGQPYNQLRVSTADGSAIAAIVTDGSTYRPRYDLNGVRLAFECTGVESNETCVVPDVSGAIESLGDIGNGAGRIVVSDAAEGIDPAFTSGPAAFAWNPSFADEIAFFRDSIDGTTGAAVSHLFRASYDGATVSLYTPNGMDDGQGPLQVVGTIDWSVNGDIAFTAFPLGQSSFNTDLYVIRADGTGLRRLTQMSFVSGPVFSPDGSEILFAYNGDGTKLYRISSAGQPNDEVPIHFGYFNGSPLEDLGWDWSPDGTEIVLADPTYSDGELVIVKVRSTTTDATYTDDRVLIGRVGGAASVTDRQPSWRP